MTFGKSVLTETLELLKATIGEVGLVAVFEHAANEAIFECEKAMTFAFPGGHGATKGIGFAGGEVGGDDRELHRLFLEEGDAEGFAEDFFDFFSGVNCRFVAVSSTEVRVDHFALNGTGSHNRDFDHKIVKLAWAKTWQHRHLCTRFNLEDTDRVGGAHHVIDNRIFARDLVHLHGLRTTWRSVVEVERFADA